MSDDRLDVPRTSSVAGLRLAAIGWMVYWAGRTPHAGQWDSFDYLKQIVTHRLSDLGFGRPIFLGYNIALWEATKKALHLQPLQVETVAVATTVALGGVGILLLHRIGSHLSCARAAALAALALLLSPVYAVYSGYVMTEVPMLTTLLAAAAVVVEGERRSDPRREIAAGLLFGAAIGIREHAAVWAGAYAWLIAIRRHGARERIRSVATFAAAAGAAALAPVVALYAADPASFAARMRTWLAAIPTGPEQVPRNIQASLLYLFAAAPAAWIALSGAAVLRAVVRTKPATRTVEHPAWGIVCGLIIPVVSLWRDADVQIHPRYLLIALPASVVICAAVYAQWVPSRRAATVWAVLHLACFAVAAVPIRIFRQAQYERKAYVEELRRTIPGDALLIGGGYSAVLDYYRVVGGRPGWRILWSGWGWSRENVRASIAEAVARGEPVYVCDGPNEWLNFELERLELHQILQSWRTERVAPGLTRVR